MSLTDRNLTISCYCNVLLISMRAFQEYVSIPKNILLEAPQLNWEMIEIVSTVSFCLPTQNKCKEQCLLCLLLHKPGFFDFLFLLVLPTNQFYMIHNFHVHLE